MVNQYAVIENGRVVNVVLAESELADNWVKTKKAKIGDLYSGGKFTSPVIQSTLPQKKGKMDALLDMLVIKGTLSEDDANQIRSAQ